MTALLSLLNTLIAFIVVLGVLIVIHELGHYWVARWCGVKVLRFSFGFGTPLYKRKLGRDQTEWVIAALPLGGYVSMLDERETQTTIDAKDLARTFNRQSLAKRSAIVAAGPLANFLLAIILYSALNMYGLQQPRALLDAPPPGSLAAHAGITAGLEVTAIDHQPIRSMNDLVWQLTQLRVQRLPVQLTLSDQQGQVQRATLDFSKLSSGDLEADWLQKIGLILARKPVIESLTPHGAAQRAGLQAGDILLAIDTQHINEISSFIAMLRAAPGVTHALTIERQGQRLQLSLTPDGVQEKNGNAHQLVGIIGAALRPSFAMVTLRYGPIDATVQALRQVWETSVLSLRIIGKMLLGEVSLKNLSGPIAIADYAGQSARIGVSAYIAFIAFLSISVGLMNLLPIPLLDGGHLLYYLVEFILRRPPSEAFLNWAQRLGFAILASLMLVALFNDFTRLSF